MVKSRTWVIKDGFTGKPKPEDFEVIEDDIPALKDGQFLGEAEWWSVDPYQRAYINAQTPKNFRMFGFQVCKVVESKCDKFKVGDYVVGHWGWTSHVVSDETGNGSPPYVIPAAVKDVPRKVMIGLLGMPGMTAYFGVEDILKPKKGEVMLVNGAAGAVGSAVGQIGKILGCTVIGYAGSDDKVAWIKNELGFDYAFNYKTVDLEQTLKEAAPKGIDTFFDNVGGAFSNKVYSHMNMDSRIAQCGAISTYNEVEKAQIPDFRMILIGKRISLIGLHVSKYYARFPEGIAQMAQWLAAGQLKNRDTEWKGFDNIPTAFMEMLAGKNTGKAVVSA